MPNPENHQNNFREERAEVPSDAVEQQPMPPLPELDVSHLVVREFDLKVEMWADIKDDIVWIEQSHFGDEAWTEAELKEKMTSPEATVVLLTDPINGSVVGFSFANPAENVYQQDFPDERLESVIRLDGRSAYVEDIAVDKAYIGTGVSNLLQQRLVEVLISKGYKYVEADATTTNQFADQLIAQLELDGRLVEAGAAPHDSEFGEQRFFRARLTSPDKT